MKNPPKIVEPENMDDLVYYTNRSIGSGSAKVWVYRQPCPKCGKAKMGKPVENGKVLIKAKEYLCPACGYIVEKMVYEEGLYAQAKYKCPECGFEGECIVPFKRKNINGVLTLRLKCEMCEANIDVTKKMKEPKNPKNKGLIFDDD
ncbi:MAG: hypothetical protein QXK37_03880 [Candidatus Woesearchaeota archaeon]